MPCRVGITTNPSERQRHWRNQHSSTFRNWEILCTVKSKQQAQRLEKLEAERLGCKAHPGGSGPKVGNWRVYYFEY